MMDDKDIQKLGKNNGVGGAATVMLIMFVNYYGLLLT